MKMMGFKFSKPQIPILGSHSQISALEPILLQAVTQHNPELLDFYDSSVNYRGLKGAAYISTTSVVIKMLQSPFFWAPISISEPKI